MIGEIRPFDGARQAACEDVQAARLPAGAGQLREGRSTWRPFLDLFGGKELADAWTTSDDAEISKPAPDIVQAALDRVQAAPAG